MVVPLVVDLWEEDGNAPGIALASFLTLLAGLAMVATTRRRSAGGLDRRQAFLLTVGVWILLPAFGGLPFIFGAPGVSFTDAFFEAMSGMTTTGSTVFSKLDSAPAGMLLWRAMLQWFGGLGIVIVAIVFLPMMRIGGMQFFRAAAFDLPGDVIPRVTEVAGDLLVIYLGLTAACTLGYVVTGLSLFDAICHSMATLSTGGYGTHDASFGAFGAAAQYVSVLFMALSAMPFIRFIQIMHGRTRPLWTDSQIRAYLGIIVVASAILSVVLIGSERMPVEPAIRSSLFTITSLVTTTGFANTDYGQWGGVAAAVCYVVAAIGGCTGSTTGAAKVFRFQVLFSALVVQIRHLHSPHGVFPLRYQGREVEPEVLSSIMGFFLIYVSAMSVTSILLSLMGVDLTTSISAPLATMTNVGPGLGDVIGPAGNFASLPDAGKWLLAIGMLLGRLEFISVLVLFVPMFWQR